MKKIFTIYTLCLSCISTAHATVTLNVLVAYTPTALAAAGSVSSIQVLSENEAGFFAKAFVNAGSPSGQYGMSIVAYYALSTEYVNSTASLASAAADTQLMSARDAANADIVLIVNTSRLPTGNCGFSAGLLPGPAAAISAVDYSCMQQKHTFQHEIGHLLGLHHEYTDDPTTQPYALGHAWVEANNTYWTCYKTLMGSGGACGGQLSELQWSNAAQTCFGDNPTLCNLGPHPAPQGNGNSPYNANEVAVLPSTMPIVATYRNTKVAQQSILGRVITVIRGYLSEDD